MSDAGDRDGKCLRRGTYMHSLLLLHTAFCVGRRDYVSFLTIACLVLAWPTQEVRLLLSSWYMLTSFLSFPLSYGHTPHPAPLTDHTVSEEQTPLQGSSIIPPTDHTPSANSTYQPIHSELPFGQQQEEQSTIVTAHSSMLPSLLTLRPPPANTQGTSAAGV